MPKPDSAFVHCICCTRGPKGERSCAAAYGIGKAWEPGCFLGVVKPRKITENAKYNSPKMHSTPSWENEGYAPANSKAQLTAIPRTMYYVLDGTRWSLTEGEMTAWGKRRLQSKVISIPRDRKRVLIEYWTEPDSKRQTWVNWSSLVCHREGPADVLNF